MRPLTIVFPLFRGVTQLDFTGPHQVFSRVPGAKVVAASLGGHDIEADGLVFAGLANLADQADCDILCVPGGYGTTEAMLDAAFLGEIRRLAAGARYVTSVCSGALILAAAGLLTGKRAATHWAWRELLGPFGVTVDERRVVRSDNVITGGGVTAGIDLALAVIAEAQGEALAQRIQLMLEYAPEPPFAAGRPETAPPEVVQAARTPLYAKAVERRAAAEEAARRLRAPAGAAVTPKVPSSPRSTLHLDQATAETLGFPKPEYRSIERERRWLCRHVPRERILKTEVITDLYVTGSRLRLREARPTDGSAPRLRFTRKADIDARTRVITSIYLPEEELAVLAASLKGTRLKKLRHRLESPSGAMLAVDEFQGELEGLILAEAELKTSDQLAAFPTPDFAEREVTDDPRFTGAYLATHGIPR